MRAARRALCLTLCLAFPAAARAQQPPTGAPADALAARVGGADGAVVLRYATRPAACGDGRDVIAVGDFLTVGSGATTVWGDGGWSGVPCAHGPARVTLLVRGGAVADVRVRVGAPRAAADSGRDLGAVGAGEAARYFVQLARTLGGRAGERAVVAAALADSADVWRPLLDLARGAGASNAGALGAAVTGDDPRAAERVADAAARWLGVVTPTEAVPAVDAALRALAAADTAPEPARGRAVGALGRMARDGAGADAGAGDAAFLRGLYARVPTDRLRERVVQAVAAAGDAAGRRWLLDLAADAGQPVAARKHALFWAGQQEELPVGDLLALDARLAGAELRRHYTFVLAQRPEAAAVTRLIAIAGGDPESGVRRQAIFWLGQSRDARARQYLEALVAR